MAGRKPKAKARKAAETATAASAASASSDYIEIKSAGAKGDGVFAIKDIPAGTVIVKEKCIMTIHKHIDMIGPWDVEAAYRKLSAEDKRTFDNMRRCVCSIPYCKGRMAIFAGNMFNVAEDWSIVGAYPTASRFNHGCAANCIVHSDDCTGEQRVSEQHEIVAIRDIAAGEELTFWYIEDVQYMTTDERRSVFQQNKNWAFNCQCNVCTLPPRERLASDLRRCIMRHLHYWIRQKGQDLPDVPSTIKLPIRKLNSFQAAMYTLLWAYLAEAEGLTFDTCRWRWWGYISAVTHVLVRASDKKLEHIPVETVENIRDWWENAHEATKEGKKLTMRNDLMLHSAAADFVMCVGDDGKIRWDELGETGKWLCESYKGSTLDY